MNPLLQLPYRLILASKSPRRSQLLHESGFVFDIMALDTDESYPSDMDTVKVPEFLAEVKAMALIAALRDNEMVLAADTVVILDGKIFGKPEDKAAASDMLRQMSGRCHEVITGICLLTRNHKVVLSDSSLVYFEHLNDAEISYYIDTYKPFDKAGSYGIQEWIGHCKINRIDGSYANVMGLPVHRVYQALTNWPR